MDALEVLRDGFGRVAENLPSVVEGIDADTVNGQPAPGHNSIGWLLWHLARIEDAQVAALATSLGLPGGGQVWDDGWYERFGLPYPREAHGYGMDQADVDRFRLADPTLLSGYYAGVHRATLALLDHLDEQQLDEVVDEDYDPPVTAGVRLVSVLDDVAQHVGQAAYLKGLLAH